jgi:membrane protein DedA with SNARE-associated domain
MAMNQVLQFLSSYGVALLFVMVLAEQAGLPVPAPPFLLAVGALASRGRFNLVGLIVVAMSACLVADYFWFNIGRVDRFNLLHKCSQRSLRAKNRTSSTMEALNRHGVGVLFLAKFVPGPNLASPLAGMSGMTRMRFVLSDGLAAAIWASSYILAGFTFNRYLERLAALGSQIGFALLLLLACVLVIVAVARSARSKWTMGIQRRSGVELLTQMISRDTHENA